jgi:hypothetical protein
MYLEIGWEQELKDLRYRHIGTHHLLPSSQSGEAQALMQSSWKVLWAWEKSVMKLTECRIPPIHPALTLEKRRPNDKWHQQ